MRCRYFLYSEYSRVLYFGYSPCSQFLLLILPVLAVVFSFFESTYTRPRIRMWISLFLVYGRKLSLFRFFFELGWSASSKDYIAFCSTLGCEEGVRLTTRALISFLIVRYLFYHDSAMSRSRFLCSLGITPCADNLYIVGSLTKTSVKLQRGRAASSLVAMNHLGSGVGKPRRCSPLTAVKTGNSQ